MMKKNLVWLILLATLWGPSFLFIKVAVAEIPPLTTVTVRVGLAALLLLAILRFKGQKLPALGPVWRHFAIMAVLAHALPFVLFCWGELYINSALASILNGTTPLFTILIAHFVISDDRMTMPKIVGALVGFQGLVILVAPSLMGGVDSTGLAIVALTIASLSYAVAMVYARIYVRGMPALVAPTAQLILATLCLLPLSLYFDRPFSLSPPSVESVASVIGLATLGTAAAFVVYYRIMENAGATYLSMVTYIVPVFGILLGIAVLNEDLAWNSYMGGAFILFGVMVANRTFRLPRHFSKSRRSACLDDLKLKPVSR